MSRDRGIRLQNALAAYLTRWWPHAESAGSGRPGTDVLGTPGVVWECKTAARFRPSEWVKQAAGHSFSDAGEVPVTVYFPPGTGALSADNALAILPMHVLMQLLVEGKYTP